MTLREAKTNQLLLSSDSVRSNGKGVGGSEINYADRIGVSN